MLMYKHKIIKNVRTDKPGGEGWGEGEQDARSLGRLRFGLGA